MEMYGTQQVMDGWGKKIVAAQRQTHVRLCGETTRLPRIPYTPDSARQCHDCAVGAGQLHVPGCDMERCPLCGGQLISCGHWDGETMTAKAASSPVDVALTIYYCTDHDGHNPTPVASIVVAKNKTQAKKLLDAKLVARGLKPWCEHRYTLTALSSACANAVILADGDY